MYALVGSRIAGAGSLGRGRRALEASKNTTGEVFGLSRAVLDSSGSFQERPTASKSVPEASRSVPERLGASWKPPGMSSRRFLDASRVTKNSSFVDATLPGGF